MVHPLNADRYNKILSLFKEGRSQVGVARHLDVAVWVVNKAIARARRIGDLPAKAGEQPDAPTKIQQCIDMYNSGMRPKDIAVKMVAPRSTVNRYLHDARKSGRIAPSRVTMSRHKRLGLMRDVTAVLTPAVMEWVYNQTPSDAIVAHTIAAIITDAYHEETEK